MKPQDPDEPEVCDLAALSRQVEAEQYFALGQERFAVGDIEDAVAYFETALHLFPTAPAHTALGIAHAARGDWEAAIEQCRSAIALDPDLGNPHNDLGVYLIEQGRLEEALPYLEQAILAPVYDCRNYPHYHRGRILERQARFTEARDAYRESLDICGDWEPARAAFHRTLGRLN